MDYIWLEKDIVLYFHEQALQKYGGLYGVRDETLLESALARPQNLFVYEQKNIYELATAYAFGIARNHPFNDANKRTALFSCYAFLKRNGYVLKAPREEMIAYMVEFASGTMDESIFAHWLQKNCAKP